MERLKLDPDDSHIFQIVSHPVRSLPYISAGMNLSQSLGGYYKSFSTNICFGLSGDLGSNIHLTSNYGTCMVFIENMLSKLCIMRLKGHNSLILAGYFGSKLATYLVN